jgi:hypothetical protein
MWKIACGSMLGGLVFSLIACGDGVATESEAEVETGALAESTEQADVANGSIADASNVSPEGGEAEMTLPPPPVARVGGDLNAYVGKFPFDTVGGVTWHDHPMVTAGIRKTVTDAAVRLAMQSPAGPSAPIATYQGKVGSWGCQQHNCGDHQWAVLVDPRSGATDVCYHNAEQTGKGSRWYLADGPQETRPGNCSVV